MTNRAEATPWRLESLECTHFKAFPNLNLKLNGRNVLMYGKNGSGKSSVYEAIKFFIDSPIYNSNECTQILSTHTNLAKTDENSASIRGTLWNGNELKTHQFGGEIKRELRPIMEKGRLASDFITYRVIYDFYSNKKDGTVNLWSIFYTEILPFYVSSNQDIYRQVKELVEQKDFARKIEKRKQEIEDEKREYRDSMALEYDDDYAATLEDSFEEIDPLDELQAQIRQINAELNAMIVEIGRSANAFYQEHFSDERNIKLNIGISEFVLDTTNPHSYTLKEPIIQLTISLYDQPNKNPLMYLNEATLTRIALSIRLGASLMMLNRDTHSTKSAEIKLLVIDDLLISLDMDNRMKVIEILFGKTFADFQKIIMTHDEAFFAEILSRTYLEHTQWEIIEVNYMDKNGYKTKKDYLQKAEDYLYGYIYNSSDDSTKSKPDPDLDAAGVNIRKAAEMFVREYSKLIRKVENQPWNVFSTRESKEPSLANQINQVTRHTMNAIPIRLYYEYLRDITAEDLRLVIPNHVNDIDEHDKQRIKELREKLYKIFADTPWRLVRNIGILLKLDASRNRILNPAAHDDKKPKYAADFDEALKLLKTLTRIVHDPDYTAPLMRFEEKHIIPVDPAIGNRVTQPAPSATAATKSATQLTTGVSQMREGARNLFEGAVASAREVYNANQGKGKSQSANTTSSSPVASPTPSSPGKSSTAAAPAASPPPTKPATAAASSAPATSPTPTSPGKSSNAAAPAAAPPPTKSATAATPSAPVVSSPPTTPATAAAPLTEDEIITWLQTPNDYGFTVHQHSDGWRIHHKSRHIFVDFDKLSDITPSICVVITNTVPTEVHIYQFNQDSDQTNIDLYRKFKKSIRSTGNVEIAQLLYSKLHELLNG